MYRIFILSFIFLISKGLYGARAKENKEGTIEETLKRKKDSELDKEGGPCFNSRKQYGLCININDCTELINLLLTQTNNQTVRNFLRASACGFVGGTPLVCCPQAPEKNVNPIFTTSTTQKPIGRTPRVNNIYTLPRVPNCGFTNQTTPRVVNGIPAKLGEFPWIVALGYRNPKNPDVPKWLCGGSLITDRHILTAAHCVYNRKHLYTARLGDLDLYSDDDGAFPETIPLVNAKIHENYNHTDYTNDIAILTLARSPLKTTAWPVCLPTEPDLKNNDFRTSQPTVAGWGATSSKGPFSPTLMQVVLPVVDNARCQKSYGNKTHIDNRVLCAGYEQGGKDSCQGDSGGPLMYRKIVNKKIYIYQIGVVSFGIGCADAKYPGVYTRMTTFLDWIQRNVE